MYLFALSQPGQIGREEDDRDDHEKRLPVGAELLVERLDEGDVATPKHIVRLQQLLQRVHLEVEVTLMQGVGPGVVVQRRPQNQNLQNRSFQQGDLRVKRGGKDVWGQGRMLNEEESGGKGRRRVAGREGDREGSLAMFRLSAAPQADPHGKLGRSVELSWPRKVEGLKRILFESG